MGKIIRPKPVRLAEKNERKGKAIKRRFDFWKKLERQLIKHKLAPDNADRIRNQVAEVIPLVTKEEFATMEADLKQIKANSRVNYQMM